LLARKRIEMEQLREEMEMVKTEGTSIASEGNLNICMNTDRTPPNYLKTYDINQLEPDEPTISNP
jgi:hypothetical protein